MQNLFWLTAMSLAPLLAGGDHNSTPNAQGCSKSPPQVQQVQLDVLVTAVKRSADGKSMLKWDEILKGSPSNSVPFGVVTNKDEFIATLQALRAKGLTKTLAEPRIMTVSGRPARIVSGGEIPILTSSGLGAPSVSYKEFGTIIEILPTVSKNGKIVLDIRPEVSAIDDPAWTFNAATPTAVPSFRTQSAQVTAMIDDGQTFAFAGLIYEDSTPVYFPILGSLPYIGKAFRLKGCDSTYELIVLVTPHVGCPQGLVAVVDETPALEPVSPRNHPTTLDEIVKMSQAGASAKIILRQIEATGAKFDLSAEDIVYLRKEKVGNNVISAIQEGRSPNSKAGWLRPDISEAAPPRNPLCLAEIMQMSRAGICDKAIIQQIEATKSTFSLSDFDVKFLRDQRVSDAVLRCMQSRPSAELAPLAALCPPTDIRQTEAIAPPPAIPAPPQCYAAPPSLPFGAVCPFPAPTSGADLKAELRCTAPFQDPTNTLGLVQGRARLLTLKAVPRRIQVSNESLMSYALSGPNKLTLLGKKAGTTVINFWFVDADDEKKETVLSILVRVFPDPEAVKRREQELKSLENRINKAFPDSLITLELLDDNVVVNGRAHDIEDAANILKIVGSSPAGGGRGGLPTDSVADKACPDQSGKDQPATPGQDGDPASSRPRVINKMQISGVRQVMLKVIVAEVNRSELRHLGLGKQNVVVYANRDQALDGGQVLKKLNALKDLGCVKSLAEPTLVALNGQSATFSAGGSFPLPLVDGKGGIDVPYGVELNFTPHITDRDRIRLSINANISTRDANSRRTIKGSDVRGLNTRDFSSTLELRDGQTMLVGGLIRTDAGNDRPAADKELIILITPELVDPMNPREIPRPEQQIMLKVRVAEVNSSELRLLNIGDQNATICDDDQLDKKMNALMDLGCAKSLAEPNIVAVSGQRAAFSAGGSFPVHIIGSEKVSYVPYGLQLSFTPQITGKDRIRLNVNATASARDTTGNCTIIGGVTVPALNSRNFASTLELRAGQTLAISRFLPSERGSDLPSADKEVVILITPEVIGDNTEKDGLMGAGAGAEAGAPLTRGEPAGTVVGGLFGGLVGAATGNAQDRVDARDKYVQAVAAAQVRNQMTLTDIVQLSQQNVPVGIIIRQINSSGSVFSLRAEDIAYLRDQGVSDQVISHMQTRRSAQPVATPYVPSATVADPYSPPSSNFGIGVGGRWR